MTDPTPALDPRQVSIIIACFREADTIQECLRRTVQAMPGAEILVIHGGPDDTADRARVIARDHPQVRVYRHYGDSGKGHAIKTGITLAQHDLLVQIDADLQFMPEDIPKVLAPLWRREAEVVFGARFLPDSDVRNYQFSFFRVIGNRIVNRYFSLLTGQPMADVTTGLKAWTRQAIDQVNFQDNRFVYEAEIAVKSSRLGYRIRMVPIAYQNRLGGVSGHGVGLRETVSIILTGFKILGCGTLWRLGWKR